MSAHIYMLVATKPDGSEVFWTYRGFSKYIARAAKMISLDFADCAATVERKCHPDWDFKLRVYLESEQDEFVDECGPLPTCPKCGLAVGVCECPHRKHPYIPRSVGQ